MQTIGEMLGSAGIVTGLGIAVVFGFLIIMIFSMKLLHVVLHAFKLDKIEEAPKSKAASKSASAGESKAPAADQKAIIAAIAVAIKEKESLNS